jgi:hypothetical protein
MKNLSFLLLFSIATGLLACRKESNQTVTVDRDCTGTYLEFNGKDYKVCNLEKVADYPDGTIVIATFKEIKECNDSAYDTHVSCQMLHHYEGWIEVEKIRIK